MFMNLKIRKFSIYFKISVNMVGASNIPIESM